MSGTGRNPFRRKKEAVEEETVIKSTRRDTTPKEKPVKTTSKITPISKSSRKQVASDMEVCVIKPSSIAVSYTHLTLPTKRIV